jgi:DNA-binding response OmpR family regulator
MKLLIVEDEKVLRESMQKYLEYQGYLCETADNFVSAKNKIQQFDYDCIVLDIGLPLGSGLDIVRELKNLGSKAGIIIISARNSLEDKITGLESGSDDYLAKPFHLSELNARINALLRRRTFGGSPTISFKEISIRPDAQRITINDKTIDLTEKEYRLLEYFVVNQRRVLTKNAITEHVWGDDYESVSSHDFIYTHIRNLRKKLIDIGCGDYIKTVYGSGYMLTDA